MTTDNRNSSSVPAQRSQQVSVTDACHCLDCLLSCISLQAMSGHDREFWLNGHLGVDSAGPYPAMNYVNTLPPTRYISSMGYDDPPHLVTVGVSLQSLCPLC
jgi:hypothetical protein